MQLSRKRGKETLHLVSEDSAQVIAVTAWGTCRARLSGKKIKKINKSDAHCSSRSSLHGCQLISPL